MNSPLISTTDAIKYSKDCRDFVKLDDGTITGEFKYCNLSTICRQIDILPDGKNMPMEAHYLPIVDGSGEVVSHELFCTGKYDIRSLIERVEDDKAS